MMDTVFEWENISRIVDKRDKLWWKRGLNGDISVKLLTKRASYGGNLAYDNQTHCAQQKFISTTVSVQTSTLFKWSQRQD